MWTGDADPCATLNRLRPTAPSAQVGTLATQYLGERELIATDDFKEKPCAF